MPAKLTVNEKNDKKALQRLLDKRDEELHTKLRRTKGYADLVRMRAAATLLLQAVHRDMEKLLKRHDPEAELAYVIHGVARDEQAAGFDFRHLPLLTEDAAEYAKEHVNLRKHELARAARQKAEAERQRVSFAVDCGLPSALNRSVPTMIIGSQTAVNWALARAVNTARDSAAKPKILHFSAVSLYTAERTTVVPANEWGGTYNHAHRSGVVDADLFVVDDALHYCRPVYRANNKPDPGPDRVLRVARKLRGVCRSRNAAILFGVPIGPKERVSDYMRAEDFAYPITAEIEGAEVVLRDASGNKTVRIPYRKPPK